MPIVTNLRADPWERYQTESGLYTRWWGEQLWAMVPAGVVAAKFFATFKDYPPSQAGGSFGIDQLQKKVNDNLQKMNK